MSLAAATGLSTAQQSRMQDFDPIFDPVTGIPASIASKSDVDNVISDLASTANAKGASQVGVEDSGGLLTATDVEGALAELAGSVDSPAASTEVGTTKHVKITTPGGATANTDKALPAGTWEVLDVYAVQKGAGTPGDLVKLVKDTGGDITNDMDISLPDNSLVRAMSIDDANTTLIGGTDALRVTETDGGGSDSPIVDVHVLLRQIA